MAEKVLELKDLNTHFETSRGVARAVDGVSLSLTPGKTLALVGESGSGKTMVALSIMGLVPSPPGRIVSGEVLFKGEDLVRAGEKRLREVRGNHISMIFQEPMTSLNPVFRVGEQVGEALKLHRGVSRREAWREAGRMLAQVGIKDPDKRAASYPHELSGGMRQRVMIAMALACDPDVLLADEPTTALDVTIQAEILELMRRLQEDRGAAMLLITHDLGVVAQTSHEVCIMYAGQIVEYAGVREVFKNPQHPYTRGLLASVPRLGPAPARLTPVPGVVPSLTALPEGCRFNPRCPHAFDRCRIEAPGLIATEEDRRVRCWLYD